MFILGAYDKWTYNNDSLKISYNVTLDTVFSLPVNNGTLTTKNSTLLQQLADEMPVNNGTLTATNSTLLQQLADESKTEEIFCQYTPFMFAFVVCVICWVFVMVPFCFVCTVLEMYVLEGIGITVT